MSVNVDNQLLVTFFFRQSENDSSLYFCRNEKCKPKRGKKLKGYKQHPGKGYTNLRNHLRSCIGENFEQVYRDHIRKSGGTLDNYCFSSTRDSEVYKLLEWVIMRSHPLCEVDSPLTISLLNMKPLSSKTLRKYILSLVPLVENEIKTMLSKTFAIMFDGWTDNSIHYVAVFACYLWEGKYMETLLACAPLL